MTDESNKYGYGGCLLWLIFLAALIALASCRSQRDVIRTVQVKDSTAIRQVDSLLQIHRGDSMMISLLSESAGTSSIVFQDTGTTKIIYRPDGSIESIEGKLRSANNIISKKDQEYFFLKKNYDSLFSVKKKDSIITRDVVREKIVEKKVSVFPWWLFLIVGLLLTFGYWMTKKKAGK